MMSYVDQFFRGTVSVSACFMFLQKLRDVVSRPSLLISVWTQINMAQLLLFVLFSALFYKGDCWNISFSHFLVLSVFDNFVGFAIVHSLTVLKLGFNRMK